MTLGPDRVALLDARDGRPRPLSDAQVGRGAWLPGLGDTLAVRFAVDGATVFDTAAGTHWSARTCDGQGTVAVARAPRTGPSPGAVAVVCDSGWVHVLGEAATATRFDSGLGTAWRSASTAAWQADGRGLLIGTHSGAVGAFAWPGGARRYQLHAGVGQVLRIASDGARATAVGDQGGALVWDVQTGAELARLPASAGRTVAMTADGEIHLFGSTLSRWHVPADARAFIVPGGERDHGMASATVSPDGTRIALARADGTVLVLRAADGAAVFRDRPADHVLKFTAWSSDGARLAVASPQTPGLVEYAATADWSRLPDTGLGALRRVVALSSGARVAAPYSHGLLVVPAQIHTAPLSYAPTSTAGVAMDFRDLSVSLDQRHAVAVDAAGGVHRCEDGAVVSCRFLTRVAGAEVADVALGGSLFAVGSEGRVALFDAAGVPLRAALTGGDRIHDIAFSPDRSWLAVGELAGAARVIEVASLKTRAVLAAHTRRVSAVAFDPAGRWLLTASWDGSARLWDLPTLTTAPAVLAAQAEARWGPVGVSNGGGGHSDP
ncbi:MAG: hypothetical protein FJ100_11615 [Deltaproteobacteria bacterium]|nr:hypothetical protein [Deltaproteobacteria bacterium]